MSRTCDQLQRLTFSKVAADWRQLMIAQRTAESYVELFMWYVSGVLLIIHNLQIWQRSIVVSVLLHKLEGTHIVQTHAALLYLWPFNAQTMSLLGYPKVIPYTKFEHFGDHSFLSYAATISVKIALIDPVTLTLTFNHETMSLLGYLKVIPYTKFEHFWIIRCWIMLRTDRQTDK